MAKDDRPGNRGDDAQEIPRVFGFKNLGELGVAKAQVPEFLLGVHHARLGLVQGRQHLEFRLAGDGTRTRKRLSPLGRGLSKLQCGIRGDVLGLCRRDPG